MWRRAVGCRWSEYSLIIWRRKAGR
jgi:hypothetical protein